MFNPPFRLEFAPLEIDARWLEESHPDRKALESAALGCPVHHSIHPEIEVLLNWHWV